MSMNRLGLAVAAAFVALTAGCAQDAPQRYDLHPAPETTSQRVGFVHVESAAGKHLGYAEVMQMMLSGYVKPNFQVNVYNTEMVQLGMITQQGEAFRFDDKSEPVSLGIHETRIGVRSIYREERPIRLYGSQGQMTRAMEMLNK